MPASKGCTQARDENNGMLAVHLASKGCTQAVDENFLALDSGSRVASRCCFLMGK